MFFKDFSVLTKAIYNVFQNIRLDIALKIDFSFRTQKNVSEERKDRKFSRGGTFLNLFLSVEDNPKI